MKKIFAFFLVLVTSMGIVYASDTQVDGIWYDFDSYNHTASVTYRGSRYSSYDHEYSGNVVIPSSVTYNGTTYSVTSIGDYAFYDCSSLTSVTIPNSVTSIGKSPFEGCSSFTKTNYTGDIAGWCNIKFGSYYANPMYYSHNFYINDQEIKDLVIPNNVTSIGDYAFSGCSSLTSVTIPNSVTSIGHAAFWRCTSLTSPIYNAHCFAYMPTSYSGAYTIPVGIEQIAGAAFFNCESLTSVTIGNSVTSIGNSAFQTCSSLTSVTIGNSVTSIGRLAFAACSSLTSITIPNSVTSIGEVAFAACSSLTSIIIPNSVTKVGGGIFYGCSLLESIVLSENITSLPYWQDNRSYYGFFDHCKSLTSITIPESVTSIGSYAFRGCSSLTKTNYTGDIAGWCNIEFGSSDANPIHLSHNFYINDQEIEDLVVPNSVTSIRPRTFSNCSSFTSVTIPNSVTSIGYDAFNNCEKLGTLVLGDKVKNIGDEAFNGCNKLYHIYCYAPEPPVIAENVFSNYNVNLYVPCNYLDNYKYDRVFGSFRYIQCIDSEDITTDDVVVTPGTNDVTITWPTEDGADTYTIIIKKGNEVFCTLTFNAEGQLLNIAFAPGRNGNHPVQYAEQAANGYRFTVTGLEEGTDYTYDITVKDASNKTIKSHSGEFTTQSTTAVDNITTNNANIQKIIRDGQFIIVRDGVEYNAVGQEM